MLNCSSLNTSVIATSKARVYTASLDQILSTPGGVQPPHLLRFAT